VDGGSGLGYLRYVPVETILRPRTDYDRHGTASTCFDKVGRTPGVLPTTTSNEFVYGSSNGTNPQGRQCSLSSSPASPSYFAGARRNLWLSTRLGNQGPNISDTGGNRRHETHASPLKPLQTPHWGRHAGQNSLKRVPNLQCPLVSRSN